MAGALTATSYIDQLVKRYVDGDVSPSKQFPAHWSHAPAHETLVRAWDASSAPPPLAEAMPRLESLIHPSIVMAMAPPVCAAAPRRSREDCNWSRQRLAVKV